MKKLLLIFMFLLSPLAYSQTTGLTATVYDVQEGCGGVPFVSGIYEECMLLQQWSPFFSEWNNVAVIYGFGLNREICGNISNTLTQQSRRDVVQRRYRCVLLN